VKPLKDSKNKFARIASLIEAIACNLLKAYQNVNLTTESLLIQQKAFNLTSTQHGLIRVNRVNLATQCCCLSTLRKPETSAKDFRNLFYSQIKSNVPKLET
jgi:RNase P/RNase MRP subunit POP5